MHDYLTRLEQMSTDSTDHLPGPADAFLLMSQVMREYTELHIGLPTLPPEIVPTNWPGRHVPAVLAEVSARLEPLRRDHVYSIAEARGVTGLIEPLRAPRWDQSEPAPPTDDTYRPRGDQ